MDSKEYLKEIVHEGGGLYSLGWYLSWNPSHTQATLDGQFTAEDLANISDYMNKYARDV